MVRLPASRISLRVTPLPRDPQLHLRKPCLTGAPVAGNSHLPLTHTWAETSLTIPRRATHPYTSPELHPCRTHEGTCNPTASSREDSVGRKGDGGAEASAPHPHPASSPAGNSTATCLTKNTKFSLRDSTLDVRSPRPAGRAPPSALPTTLLFVLPGPGSRRATCPLSSPTFRKGALAVCHSGTESPSRGLPDGASSLSLSLSPPASPPAAPGSSRCLPRLIMPCHAATELWSHTGFTCHK